MKLMMLTSGRRPQKKFLMVNRQSYNMAVSLSLEADGCQQFAAESSVQAVLAYLKTSLVLSF